VLIVVTFPARARCGTPAGEQLQCVLGPRAGLGAVGGQRQARVGQQLHGVEGDIDEADDRVGEVFGPVLVQPHVVRRPAGAEVVAAGGEIANQVGELTVVGVTAGFAAQHRDSRARDVVPAWVEVAGLGVQETEPGQVGRSGWVVEDR
jgi:hypothetical protein